MVYLVYLWWYLHVLLLWCTIQEWVVDVLEAYKFAEAEEGEEADAGPAHRKLLGRVARGGGLGGLEVTGGRQKRSRRWSPRSS